MTAARKAFRYFEYTLTLALIVFGAYCGIEYASGSQPLVVISDNPSSMSPTINYGGLTITYRTPFQDLKVGEIIAFNDPRGIPSVIVHRIVAIVTCSNGIRCVITKGDNSITNPTNDPWNVTQSDYKSQVILIIPYAGYLSPSLWGLKGYEAALPIIFVALLIAFVSWVFEQRTKNKSNSADVVLPNSKEISGKLETKVEKIW